MQQFTTLYVQIKVKEVYLRFSIVQIIPIYNDILNRLFLSSLLNTVLDNHNNFIKDRSNTDC